MAGGKKKWLINVAVYTIAGGMASTLVGAGLGLLGHWIVPAQSTKMGTVVAIAVSTLAATREFGWISLPLPQWARQTQRIWGMRFHRTLAAALWGFDLGLTFTTRLTFSGVWFLAAMAIFSKDPAYGAALFTLYWLGRVLSVWLAPLLMWDANSTPQLLDAINEQYQLFRRIHAWALVSAVAILCLWLIHGTPMLR